MLKEICFVLIFHAAVLQSAPSGDSHDIKKILIIGGTGQAGSGMVREALSRGLHVRVMSRHASKVPEDIRNKVKIITGDVQNYQDVESAVKGVDAVIVAISTNNYEDTSNYMTRGLQNVLKAMKAANVPLINALLSDFVLMKTEDIPALYRNAVKDQHAMYDALKSSGLTYIASCPADFTHSPADGYIARNDVLPDATGDANVISLNQLSKYFIDVLSQPVHYGHLVSVVNKGEVKKD
ncbi:unnamed protein product [Phyllotreta striolata]|uniref:NAD(P)-binding domain-containing protein n=1 Tax=Phyllotreta striolata TaxID=444603 RepID=A0A9N9XR97_PHYSR|nr:unnamed protein product [Phyllotreta striolata]